MFLRLLFLTLILIVLGQTPLMRPIEGLSARTVTPPQYAAYRLSQNLKKEFDFLVNLRYLRVENLRLGQRILELESTLALRRELEQENKKLREQLDVADNSPDQGLILAQVVGRSSRGGEAVVTVNRGADAGVAEGAVVIFRTFLLGEVAAVEPGRAKIRLLTDSSFSAAALDQDSPDRARGLVSGQYGTAVTLKKVLPTEQLVVGDTIITSGEDGKFEKGLILGTVKKIYGQEADVFKSAELELMVNLDSLEEVFISSRTL